MHRKLIDRSYAMSMGWHLFVMGVVAGSVGWKDECGNRVWFHPWHRRISLDVSESMIYHPEVWPHRRRQLSISRRERGMERGGNKLDSTLGSWISSVLRQWTLLRIAIDAPYLKVTTGDISQLLSQKHFQLFDCRLLWCSDILLRQPLDRHFLRMPSKYYLHSGRTVFLRLLPSYTSVCGRLCDIIPRHYCARVLFLLSTRRYCRIVKIAGVK